MIAVADAAEFGTEPPREVLTVSNIKRWGDPHGGGWMDWPAGDLLRFNIADNITQAFQSLTASKSGDFTGWQESNPGYAEIFHSITGLRIKMAANDGD